MKSGFVITPRGATALELPGTFGVRYGATLTSGEGFAAFDPIETSDIIELQMQGKVYLESTGPWTAAPKRPTIAGPKRKRPQFDEVFAILAPYMHLSAQEHLSVVAQWEGARGASIITHDFVPMVIVEFGLADNMPPWPTVWHGQAVEHRDVRELVPA